jgi:hypothetical protein
MNQAELKEFEYLWTTHKHEYVLTADHPNMQGRYDIFQKASVSMLLIEDDELAKEVEQRMLEAGVPVLESSLELDEPDASFWGGLAS